MYSRTNALATTKMLLIVAAVILLLAGCSSPKPAAKPKVEKAPNKIEYSVTVDGAFITVAEREFSATYYAPNIIAVHRGYNGSSTIQAGHAAQYYNIPADKILPAWKEALHNSYEMGSSTNTGIVGPSK